MREKLEADRLKANPLGQVEQAILFLCAYQIHAHMHITIFLLVLFCNLLQNISLVTFFFTHLEISCLKLNTKSLNLFEGLEVKILSLKSHKVKKVFAKK